MKRILLTLLLIPLAAFGQKREPVMTDTNGVVTFPNNFFGLNAASNALALTSYFQAASANLTALAALAPANGDVPFWTNGAWSKKDSASFGGAGGLSDAPSDGSAYVRKNGSWVAPTTRSAYQIADAQPLDADLTALAALTPSNGDFPFWTNSAWTLKNVSTIGGGGGGISDAPSDGTRYLRLNAAWTALDADLQRIADIGAATGDTLYRDATGWTNRAIGSSGQVWTVVGGVPAWATSSSGTSVTLNGSTVITNIADSFHSKGSLTGQTLKLVPGTPVTLTDAATIATDASLGTTFRVTLGGNRTLGNPTNPTDGQRCIWEVSQDATGGRTLAADTKFAFGNEITAPASSINISTNASSLSFITAIYNSTADKWRVVGNVTGY